jgi:hypothetical protein
VAMLESIVHALLLMMLLTLILFIIFAYKPRRFFFFSLSFSRSPIATFLNGVFGQILSEPLRLIVWRFISLFLSLFPDVFCFSLFSRFLVFPRIVLSLFVLCVFYFCSFADLLCVDK